MYIFNYYFNLIIQNIYGDFFLKYILLYLTNLNQFVENIKCYYGHYGIYCNFVNYYYINIL